MREHRPDGAENEHQINVPHPAIQAAAEIRTTPLPVRRHMNFPEREFCVGARMTFTTRHDQIQLVDGRIGVRGRQDFVVAVATGAIRRHGGTVLRGEAVIAVKKRFHAVRRQIVFGIQALGSMAAAANILRNTPTPGGTALERTNLVIVMAARTGGGVLRPGGHGPAMDAGLPVAHFFVMARAARRRLPRKIKGRGRRTLRNDLMGIMAVATGGGIRVAGFQSDAMDALGVAFGLPHMAQRALDRRKRFAIVGMLRRDVRVATDAVIGAVRGELQLGRIHIQGKGFAGGVGFEERVVAVAIQAITVFHPGHGGTGRKEQQRNNY